MLGGICSSCSTRWSALTASPREAPGARLKDSVTTGNWPRCWMEIGAELSSTRDSRFRGTCPPLGKTAAEAIGAAVVAAAPELAKLLAAAALELIGPRERSVVDEPPA